MVAVESSFEIPEQDEVSLVSQRKYKPDPSRPWWERLFFQWIWLPFNRFSIKVMNIGALAGVDAEGNLFMLEEEGVYLDDEVAQKNCKGEFWCVKKIPLNMSFPGETVQYKGHVYPRSIMPDRYRRRTYPIAPAPVCQLAQIKKRFETISKTAGV